MNFFVILDQNRYVKQLIFYKYSYSRFLHLFSYIGRFSYMSFSTACFLKKQKVLIKFFQTPTLQSFPPSVAFPTSIAFPTSLKRAYSVAF